MTSANFFPEKDFFQYLNHRERWILNFWKKKKENYQVAYYAKTEIITGFQSSARGKDPACECRRHKKPEFDHWVRKIPWRSA